MDLYKITEAFPKDERYGLVSQMRRSAVSIPSNIAEGFRRGSRSEKTQFLRIASGSGAELETQLEISKELGYVSELSYNKLKDDLDKIMRMINKALSSIQNQ